MSSSNALLQVDGLSFSYSDETDDAQATLQSISFRIDGGQILALLGPNGSGKSTLLKIIAGMLPYKKGSVLLNGKLLQSIAPLDRARSVAYVAPELRAEFPLTAYETVRMGRSIQGSTFRDRLSHEDEIEIQKAMERCRCWDLKDRDLHTLSGGERQLVAMARALAQGARLLLLDESLGKMDLQHQSMVGSLLKVLATQGFSAILVSHDVNLVTDWVDHCMLLQNGKTVAQGDTCSVLTEQNIRRLYPGAELIVGTNPSTGMPKIFFR